MTQKRLMEWESWREEPLHTEEGIVETLVLSHPVTLGVRTLIFFLYGLWTHCFYASEHGVLYIYENV